MSNPLLDGDLDAPADLTLREIVSKRMRRRFDLRDDAAYEGQTLENVRAGIKFQGANLWILMLAILICSIGLNVNSTAVIIGAMLISPLMGPILGVGCGAAISDTDLLLTSAKNLGIATGASIAVSAGYFAVSPLSDAQSELLARTAPTLFDVLIATFGGLVGIIALSRRNQGNAIPGVAIATALMPPICTAGYSLATQEWRYLAGSLYLYFINLTFIAFATFVLVRVMRFKQYKFVDERSERKTKQWIYVVVFLMAAPSFYTAYSTVQDSVLEGRVDRFIAEEFDLPDAQVIGRRVLGFEDAGGPSLKVMLLGEPLSDTDVDLRRERLRDYALDGFELYVIQAGDLDDEALQEASAEAAAPAVDFAALYRQTDAQLAAEREELRRLRKTLADYQVDTATLAQLRAESRALYPSVEDVSVGRLNGASADTTLAQYVVRVRTRVPLSQNELSRYGEWVKARQGYGRVVVVQ